MHGVWQVDMHGLPDRAAGSCLARAAKEGGRMMITIGEYIAWRQPDVAAILLIRLSTMCVRELKSQLPYSIRELDRLMRERPMPGRGGLLRGEKAV